MLASNPSFANLAASIETLAEAGRGLDCESMEVLALAEASKFEFDRYFGEGNWYSSTVVRVVGPAMRGYPTKVPCEALSKLAAVLRSASQTDALRFQE